MFPSRFLLFVVLAIMLVACAGASPESVSPPAFTNPAPDATSLPSHATQPEAPGQVGLPNPASVYCEEHGGRVDIRSDSEGNQFGMCVFADASECDEWAFYRGECQPSSQQAAPQPLVIPAYSNTEYGFSVNPPSTWAIEEHEDYLVFSRPDYKLFAGFQWAGDDPKPFRTGMPEGDFVDGGNATLLGQPLPKQILVFEGKNKVVAYGGRVKVGDLILVFYLDPVQTDTMSYQELDIPAEIIAEADQIIASFALLSGESPEIELNP
jgi:putative hemolysin